MVDWLWTTTHQEHAFSQVRQYELFFTYLNQLEVPREEVTDLLAQDFLVNGTRKNLPEILRPAVEAAHGRTRIT